METEFDSTKKIIVVCAQGYVSDIVAQKLQEKYEAYSVDGGYVSIVMDKMNTNVSDDFCAQVERSMSSSKKAIVLRYVFRVEKIRC